MPPPRTFYLQSRSALALLALMALLPAGSSRLAQLEAREALVDRGASWRFFRGRAFPGARWRESDFDDSRWERGAAPFRYGDGRGGTELLGMRRWYSCVFLRRSFQVADLSQVDRIALEIDYDDGFVVWINGTRVLERNAPRSLNERSLATHERESGTPERFVLEKARRHLRRGENIIAVQGLNISTLSSDFVIDLELRGESRLPPSAAPQWDGPDRGFVHKPFDLGLRSEQAEARIVYTLDGRRPDPASSAVYSAPLRLADTSIVRAVAVAPGHDPSPILTLSFIFPARVARQGERALPGAFYSTAMDPELSPQANRIEKALLALESVSLVLDPRDLNGRDGLHEGANLHRDLERPVSIEWLDPEEPERDFQVDAGIKIQGGASRWQEGHYDPKQSFSLKFRKCWGPGKLRAPIFERAAWSAQKAARSFDRLVLRAGHNKSWAGPGPGARSEVTYLRDQWARDTQLALSGAGSRGDFVHLYINGLYWGIYNLVERPDEHFAASYLGRGHRGWEVRKAKEQTIEGDGTAWREVLAAIEDRRTPWADVEALVDVRGLIDWQLVMWAVGIGDLQWYATLRREPRQALAFWVWDAEQSFDASTRRSSDGYRYFRFPLFSELWRRGEFRELFRRRCARQCAPDGPLGERASIARWDHSVERLDPAILAEAARWGDERQEPALGRREWTTATRRVRDRLRGNTQRMLEDLLRRGLLKELP